MKEKNKELMEGFMKQLKKHIGKAVILGLAIFTIYIGARVWELTERVANLERQVQEMYEIGYLYGYNE